MVPRALAPILVSLCLFGGGGVLAADGDPVRGEIVYKRCQGCHSIEVNRIGPRHAGLFGRKVGSLPDFDYSEAMTNSGVVWDEASLDRFLAAPRTFLPGNRMPFAGIKNDRERADLIAWLKQATAQ